MQHGGHNIQQEVPAIWKQSDMFVQCNNGWHYPGIRASHRLLAMVEKDLPRHGNNQNSLKLKVAARNGDPKLHVEAMRSYLRVEVLKIGNCALDGFELFESTRKRKKEKRKKKTLFAT